ncbi:unnamed protein product [Ectocarpus fasciculatus]
MWCLRRGECVYHNLTHTKQLLCLSAEHVNTTQWVRYISSRNSGSPSRWRACDQWSNATGQPTNENYFVRQPTNGNPFFPPTMPSIGFHTYVHQRLPEIARDVSDAARKNELVSGIVLGKGTEARSTVDGLKAVNRQLRQDILPKALEAARIASAVPRPSTNTTSSSTTPKRRTGPMEGIAENLYSIKNTARELTPQKLRQGLQTAAAETENIFSRTPSGLYSPSFSLEDAREGFEIRRYASYAVCSAEMDADTARGSDQVGDDETGVTDGSGEGFNTLAGYLFGDNKQEVAMDMTTPVNIDVTSTGRTMSFVMPKDVPAEEAPTPRNPRVNVRDVAEGEVLAVREFPGFATDGEVARQLDSLLCALHLEASTSASPWCAQEPVGRSYRLMQYNPPYTLPWQRTNAIAVQVYRVPGDSADAEDAKGSAEREQVSSTISQSIGSP